MNREHYLLRDVARLLKVKSYRVSYAISVGLVPEPELRISNKRIFQEKDIERLAKHFGSELDGKEGGKNRCKEGE
jgi:DNA-binding transcriptional MerR regulator